jgi:hypothetical protein
MGYAVWENWDISVGLVKSFIYAGL